MGRDGLGLMGWNGTEWNCVSYKLQLVHNVTKCKSKVLTLLIIYSKNTKPYKVLLLLSLFFKTNKQTKKHLKCKSN